MKKIFLTGILFFFVFSFAIAQKSKVSAAYNLVVITPPDFESAKSNIQSALENEATKDWVKTWYTAGFVYDKILEEEQKKEFTQTDDKQVRGESTMKAYDYFLKAYELDQLPNAKGKVKPKYTKTIVSKMKTYPLELFNYGVKMFGEQKYKEALESWERYLNMPNLPFLKDQIKEDSMYIYTTYYSATASIVLEDTDKAIKYLEQVKDKYMISESYQFLSQQYLAKQDTANYFKTIKSGFEKYPTNAFLLESLINYYIFFDGKVDDAIEYLDEAIKINPQMGQYYYVKANLCEIKGKEDEALSNFNKALELEPENASALAGIGRYYYKKGDVLANRAIDIRDIRVSKLEMDKANDLYKKSVEYFEKARSINNTDLDSLKLLRSLYYKLYKDENNPKYIEVGKAIKELESKY